MKWYLLFLSKWNIFVIDFENEFICEKVNFTEMSKFVLFFPDSIDNGDEKWKNRVSRLVQTWLTMDKLPSTKLKVFRLKCWNFCEMAAFRHLLKTRNYIFSVKAKPAPISRHYAY